MSERVDTHARQRSADLPHPDAVARSSTAEILTRAARVDRGPEPMPTSAPIDQQRQARAIVDAAFRGCVVPLEDWP